MIILRSREESGYAREQGCQAKKLVVPQAGPIQLPGFDASVEMGSEDDYKLISMSQVLYHCIGGCKGFTESRVPSIKVCFV
ncbi:hypothetical protein VTO42DRAFT_2123 [Malbranchea cinnamomea]